MLCYNDPVETGVAQFDDLMNAAAGLRSGGATSAGLTARALAAATAADGQGRVVYTRLYAEAAMRAAAQSDARRAMGAALSPIDGVPVSIKDLFDVAGETTLAGSVALADEPVATADAEVVARLRRAGAIIVGKTVMTEFALSGLGLNPHYGTPLSPWDRDHGRIAGGSSSGAAASVADGMALAALGTDTGGSVRIPAAFCGLVGFKPTAARVSLQGAFALSPSLDSVGPIAHTVAGCALMDQVLTGDLDAVFSGAPRLGLPRHYVMEGLDPEVAAAFCAALQRLQAAGAQIVEFDFPELLEIADLGAAGGFSPVEGYAAHAALFERVGGRCDPRVMGRFLVGRQATPQAYRAMLALRASLILRAEARAPGLDALVFPTAPMIPPLLGALDRDVAYTAANGRVIRNAAVANILDRCAISIPCHAPGSAPVGLTLMGDRLADRRLLALAAHLEAAIRG